MPTPAQLQPQVDQLLQTLLGHLSGEPISGDQADLMARYKRLKGELGGAEIARRLGLNANELEDFNKALRDLERGGGDERNQVIVQLRFLSWMETLGQVTPALALNTELEALISEELGRKQVRALELIIRSLITERFGDQSRLEQGLIDLLNGPVVEKWKRSADADDLLSGTTFSELASLLVNTKEYPNYSTMFEESPFLTYLRDKRKTIQNFLEDIRRIRNTLAHNKRVSNTQLNLLDLYYEELVAPVQEAHDQGQTKVNPDSYLDVSREELEGYFANLSEDLAGIKDDIAEFRAETAERLGVIAEDTAAIRQSTGQISQRQKLIGAGVALAVVGIGVAIWLGSSTQEETEVIRQTTDRIEQKAEVQMETTQAIARSVESIREGFSGLSKQGGIIAQPERPEEFYHNARIYELRGDFLNARKSYESFMAFGLEVIDPYLRYIDIIKAQEGAAGAATAFNAARPAEPGNAYRAAGHLLLGDEARLAALEQLIGEEPDYAPAWYLLSQQHSLKQLGQQSLHNKREEKKALEQFLALAREGAFLKHFVDKDLASAWLDDAEARLKALSIVESVPSKPAFVYKAMRSNSGWQLTFNFPEVVRRFSYRLGEQGDFIDTGVSDYIDQRLGEPPAKTWFQLPNSQQDTLIQVKYTDIQGRENGPFDVQFTTTGELVKGQKQILGMTQNSWLSFRNDPDYPFLYFTHLQSYRCAIKSVRYGLGKEEPDTLWDGLGECDTKNPNAIAPGLVTHLKISPQVPYVSVQLEYRDGTQSPVVRIDR